MNEETDTQTTNDRPLAAPSGSGPKFTPGPWRSSCFAVLAGSTQIAHTGYGQLPPARAHEAEGNAQLMAAAPDMLEALQFIANLTGPNGEILYEGGCRSIAMHAVAKALGQNH